MKQYPLTLVLLVISLNCLSIRCLPDGMQDGNRPDVTQRTFNSDYIEQVINQTVSVLTDPELKRLFTNCFPNTLDTTIFSYTQNKDGVPDTFVITGDIEAMWQRDSTNQVFPYLRFVNNDPSLKSLILGLINRQQYNANLDPYANAFNIGNTTGWSSDITTKIDSKGNVVNGMIQGLWERKYQLDSMGNVLKLAFHYYNITGDYSFVTSDWLNMVKGIVKVLQTQVLGTDQESTPAYTFQRKTTEPTDTTSHGRGQPSKKCGLIKSSFRPSDDANLLPFNIAGNAFLSTYLNHTSDMLQKVPQKTLDVEYNLLLNQMANQCQELGHSIREAIYQYGLIYDSTGNLVFAYQIDGFGNSYQMDDANVPSLLSLAYFGFVGVDDHIYQNTRKLILSKDTNPYYFKGAAGEGIGGPHVGYGYVWPMSIIMRALTSIDDNEIIECINMLKNTTGGKYFMHESFHMNDANDYTRDWFAWANTLFGELIIQILEQKPHLLTNSPQQI